MTSPQDPGGSGDQLGPGFDVVRRGYARDQVDAHLAEVERRLRAAENARRMAERHAASLNDELHELRAATPARGFAATAPSAPTFGFRVEKVLRLAERDGTEIRARAAREAAAILERAHAAAAEARAEAERERAVAARLRERSAHDGRDNAEIRGKIAELESVRESVRAELARLHSLLGMELARLDGGAAPTGVTEHADGGPAEQASAADRAEVDKRADAAGDAGGAQEMDSRTVSTGPTAVAVVPTARRPDGHDAAQPPTLWDGTVPNPQIRPCGENQPSGPSTENRSETVGPAESGARPEAVWTPTPGTADLFARRDGSAPALR